MSQADPAAEMGLHSMLSEIEEGGEGARGLRVADQVVLDREMPHLDVQAAICAQDESLIWRGYRAARDQEAWLDGLAASVGTHTIERQHFRDPSRTTHWQHMLIAWPVLLPPERRALAASGQHDRCAANGLLDQLHWWLDYRHEARLFTGVTAYGDICRWSPLGQRECLQLLARDMPEWRAPLRSVTAHLPAGFPRLSFVVGSVAEWIVRPQLPSRGHAPGKNFQLQTEAAARVGFGEGCTVAVGHVGVPQKFAAAVLEGLGAWLRQISLEALVRSWQVHLAGDDCLVVELVPAHGSSQPAQIPLRLHQIGVDGLNALVADLERCLGPAETNGLQPG